MSYINIAFGTLKGGGEPLVDDFAFVSAVDSFSGALPDSRADSGQAL